MGNCTGKTEANQTAKQTSASKKQQKKKGSCCAGTGAGEGGDNDGGFAETQRSCDSRDSRDSSGLKYKDKRPPPIKMNAKKLSTA